MAALLKLSLLVVIAYSASAQGKRKIDDYIVKPFVCTAGMEYKQDCNSCTCINDGDAFGACTLMACNLKPDECIPGSYFEIKNHLCKCPDCGYKWHSDCFARNYCPPYDVPLA